MCLFNGNYVNFAILKKPHYFNSPLITVPAAIAYVYVNYVHTRREQRIPPSACMAIYNKCSY